MHFNFEDVLRREVYYLALADSPIDVNALKSKVKKAQVRMSKGHCLMFSSNRFSRISIQLPYIVICSSRNVFLKRETAKLKVTIRLK